ncbi:hypothetical protein [Szabonella alba]|uniref:Uncharacterized protein n=1 Tax=Szabonella alba TaxID=2804194 RepID=A0A8K0Y178_9RHOB|nr:hypothetical protein [Szabonella alba]MBL4917597.1 hypothetical protein [Szabonella alba]
MFATDFGFSLTAFDPEEKNWNVIGAPFRSALNALLMVANYPNFWAHAWDLYDARIGVA